MNSLKPPSSSTRKQLLTVSPQTNGGPTSTAPGAEPLGVQRRPRASSGVTHRTRGRTGWRGPETLPQVGRTASSGSPCSQLEMPGKTQGLSMPWVLPAGPPDPQLHARGPQRRTPGLSPSHTLITKDPSNGALLLASGGLRGAAGTCGADSCKGNSAPAHVMAPPHPISRRTDSQTGSTTSAREENVCHGPVTCHHLEEQPMLVHEKTKVHPAAPGTGASRWPVCSETNAQFCPGPGPDPPKI